MLFEVDEETLKGINKWGGKGYEVEKGKLSVKDMPRLLSDLLWMLDDREQEIERLSKPDYTEDDADTYYENMRMGN